MRENICAMAEQAAADIKRRKYIESWEYHVDELNRMRLTAFDTPEADRIAEIQKELKNIVYTVAKTLK